MKLPNWLLAHVERFTAPPWDGDYDQHTMEAMEAVYSTMEAREHAFREYIIYLRKGLAAECCCADNNRECSACKCIEEGMGFL